MQSRRPEENTHAFPPHPHHHTAHLELGVHRSFRKMRRDWEGTGRNSPFQQRPASPLWAADCPPLCKPERCRPLGPFSQGAVSAISHLAPLSSTRHIEEFFPTLYSIFPERNPGKYKKMSVHFHECQCSLFGSPRASAWPAQLQSACATALARPRTRGSIS